MKAMDFMELLSELPPEMVAEAEQAEPKRKIRMWAVLPAIAACLAVLIAAAVYPKLRTEEPQRVESGVYTEATESTMDEESENHINTEKTTHTTAQTDPKDRQTSTTGTGTVTQNPATTTTAAEAEQREQAASDAPEESNATSAGESRSETAPSRTVTTASTVKTGVSTTISTTSAGRGQHLTETSPMQTTAPAVVVTTSTLPQEDIPTFADEIIFTVKRNEFENAGSAPGIGDGDPPEENIEKITTPTGETLFEYEYNKWDDETDVIHLRVAGYYDEIGISGFVMGERITVQLLGCKHTSKERVFEYQIFVPKQVEITEYGLIPEFYETEDPAYYEAQTPEQIVLQ